MTATNSPGTKLRRATTENHPLQVVGAVNAYHAIMAEKTGHQAIYLSGGGVAASSLGTPDLGISTLADVLEIFRLAKEADVPIFSSSSLRYAKSTQAVRAGSIGKVTHAIASSPAKTEEHHPDLYWYGVHGCEALFTVMGTGCESVIRRQTEDGLIEVEGTWAGGRTGIFREGKGYSGLAKGDKGEAQIGNFDGYEPLVAEIIEFFQTKQAPIPAKETIELFAFMEAADESKRQGGKPVRLTDVIKKRK